MVVSVQVLHLSIARLYNTQNTLCSYELQQNIMPQLSDKLDDVKCKKKGKHVSEIAELAGCRRVQYVTCVP